MTNVTGSEPGAVERGLKRLADTVPELERILTRGVDSRAQFAVSEIQTTTVWVSMRDGVRLATDLYLPPTASAPTIAVRTPYGRAIDKSVGLFLYFARRGYAVVAQDCRGTGQSEPDSWDYYMYEPEDGFDLVEWLTQQKWYDGFVGACGSSYVAQTQWCMATHPRMSTIAPEVSGLGIAVNTAHVYMFLSAYALSVGKGAGKVAVHYTDLERTLLAETLGGGYFNEPLHAPLSEALLTQYPHLRTLSSAAAKKWLWQQYCSLPCAGRASFVKQALGVKNVGILEVESLPAVFGHGVSHDAHTLPHVDRSDLGRSIHAPPLMITGWYDWGLNDALATWELLRREARESVGSQCRLIITPSAHNVPGYHEGMASHPELQHNHRTVNNGALLLRWYGAVREGKTADWPTVIYYLMGANEWRIASNWPPPESRPLALYLGENGALQPQAPQDSTPPDRYVYDPIDPTPTLGGSIVSFVYPPGSVAVDEVQKRADVLSFTTAPLERHLDVAGPLRLVLYASSSAVDTDFSARLSDVFPDGRAIQLQSGILRARYRDPAGDAELLEPDRIYRFEIDMWATANRFEIGHRVRVDISSADFPRFDRNSNRGGEPGSPVAAVQTIYRDRRHPSHLLLSVLTS